MSRHPQSTRRFFTRILIFFSFLIGFSLGSHCLSRVSQPTFGVQLATNESSGRLNQANQSNDLLSVSSRLDASGERVFLLLAQNSLVSFGPSETPTTLTLASTPTSETNSSGHLIATNQDRGLLFVLITGDRESRESITVVDANEMRVLKTFPLPGDVNFRNIAVGARTGFIYVTGNRLRNSQVPRRFTWSAHTGNPVVRVLNPGDGNVVQKWEANLPDEYDWRVYQAEPSDDETHILLSYHGGATTAIDSFEVSQDALSRCQVRAAENFGCVYGHGGFVQLGDRLLVATGHPEILEYKAGILNQIFDTDLIGNHVMEFAVDQLRQRIYAIGSCMYAGGLSVLDLNHGGQRARMDARAGSWQLLGGPAPTPLTVVRDREICGERIAVDNAALIVVSQAHLPESVSKPDGVLFIDGRNGHLLAKYTPKSHPVGVAIIHLARRSEKPS